MSSAAQRLLEAEFLDLLWSADRWERLRLGILKVSSVVPAGSSDRVCGLCHSRSHGLAHLLAECACLKHAREHFLNSVGDHWRSELVASLLAEWPIVLLSPHLPVERLRHAVLFCGQVSKVLSR